MKAVLEFVEVPSALAFESTDGLLGAGGRSTAHIVAAVERGDIACAREAVEGALRMDPQDPLLQSWKERLAPPAVALGGAEVADLALEREWLRTHAEAYKGRWVALGGGTLLAEAGELRELLGKLKLTKVAHSPLVEWIS